MEEPRIMNVLPYLYLLICSGLATWFSGCQVVGAHETTHAISTSLKADVLQEPDTTFVVAIKYHHMPTAIERAMIHALGGSVFEAIPGSRQLLAELKGRKIKALARHTSIVGIQLVNEDERFTQVNPRLVSWPEDAAPHSGSAFWERPLSVTDDCEF